jgi:hypothetical protein
MGKRIFVGLNFTIQVLCGPLEVFLLMFRALDRVRSVLYLKDTRVFFIHVVNLLPDTIEMVTILACSGKSGMMAQTY